MSYQHLHQVTFEETDMAGIAHFSRYAQWVEQAEHAFLQQLGIAPISREGGFPKVHFNIDYQSPVRFGDILSIELEVAEIGTSSINYEFSILNKDRVSAAGKLTTVLVNQQGRSAPIPEEWKSLLANPSN